MSVGFCGSLSQRSHGLGGVPILFRVCLTAHLLLLVGFRNPASFVGLPWYTAESPF